MVCDRCGVRDEDMPTYEERLLTTHRENARGDLRWALSNLLRIERPDDTLDAAVAELLQAIEQELPHVLRRIDGEE